MSKTYITLTEVAERHLHDYFQLSTQLNSIGGQAILTTAFKEGYYLGVQERSKINPDMQIVSGLTQQDVYGHIPIFSEVVKAKQLTTMEKICRLIKRVLRLGKH